jgi:hypothetical protein
MTLTMAALLAHSELVPPAARCVLKAAHDGPPEQRLLMLEWAARILHREGGVECADALELVDLQPSDCGC